MRQAIPEARQNPPVYWEAIRVLREGDEEIRYAVSGHLLRELQDVLPKHLQVPGTGGGAGEFWGWISVAWERVVKGRPEVVGNELWTTVAIDRPLARFLARLHEKIGTTQRSWVASARGTRLCSESSTQIWLGLLSSFARRLWTLG